MGMKYERKALELYRRLERLLLPRFEGACIDFHWERPATVFLPQIPTVVQIGNGKLPALLVSHGVNRVLVDALWPTNVEVLMKLIEDGMEVWVLTRPSALHGWRRKSAGKPRGLVEWLLRHYPEVVKGFKTEIKNDIYDAVLLRYVKPKYRRRLTKGYLTCWPRMVLFRNARKNHQRLLQQISALPEEENTTRLQISEKFLTTEAKLFVDTLRKQYPAVDELFNQLGVSDVISQAYTCEVILETDETSCFNQNRRKFGLIPKKHRNKLIYDGVAKHALVQLTIKRFGAIPKYLSEEERRRFSMELRRTLDVIYRWKKTYRRETQRLAGIPAQQQG